jgi:hypothetical protein
VRDLRRTDGSSPAQAVLLESLPSESAPTGSLAARIDVMIQEELGYGKRIRGIMDTLNALPR